MGKDTNTAQYPRKVLIVLHRPVICRMEKFHFKLRNIQNINIEEKSIWARDMYNSWALERTIDENDLGNPEVINVLVIALS